MIYVKNVVTDKVVYNSSGNPIRVEIEGYAGPFRDKKEALEFVKDTFELGTAHMVELG